ncbi:ankyrin repeat domain-containing protein 12 isoform X2 [Anoplopoma fimbria]|uniref:ankyrin repeat domain-containing protein 12 isoform X2 n=1 Tax=Anoplopoma fimbria TaxID=229290 RepID=UPI0023EBAD9C|nr:ankyrin repeat domain-containing protein 12 isoform X2 [Anoplopoma fimbria]
MAKPGSDRDGAMVDKQAGKKSKDKLSPFTKTPKLDRSELLGKEGKAKSSMKRKLSFTTSPLRTEERDSDTDDSDPGQSSETWGERLVPPCRIYADKDVPDKKKVKKESGAKKSQAPNLLFGYPLSERKQMALLMQMTANSPDSTPSHPSQTTPVQKKVPSSASSRQKDKVNKRNERGETPLHMAAIRGDAKQVKELISLGADVNVKDFAGWTPLHEACNLGYYDVAKVLIAAGAEVNTQGLDDDTPLHDASSSGHKDIVKLLLRHGGNAFQANKRGERPVDVADSQELEQLLKGEVPLSDQEDTSSESEEVLSVNPSSVDDNLEDSDTEKDSDGKPTTKPSSSVPGLDEYEFKDEEEEEDLSKALNDRHILRRELRQREKEEKERNHVAGKQSGKGDSTAKSKKPKSSRVHCSSDTSSDEMESLSEKRCSPTCSQSSESLKADTRSKKENAEQKDKDKDKGKVKKKSKSQNKNKENQEDGKENSKTLVLSLATVSESTEKCREEDSFKMSFSPKDDSSVHLFHLSSIKSPKLNHSLTDKQTPLKQENTKMCISISDSSCPVDGVKYNHYAEADYCTEGSSTKGCKHKEKSKHQQKDSSGDGDDGHLSPYKDGSIGNSVDSSEGALRKTELDGKVVKKHKLKHKEKDKHRREYEAERSRHRQKEARKDSHRNLEFDREFWKENFFKSDETDEHLPVKKEGEDNSSLQKTSDSPPVKDERNAKEKHASSKEKRPREEREKDKAVKRERKEAAGKEEKVKDSKLSERDERVDCHGSGRIPDDSLQSNSMKEETEEKPISGITADQEQLELSEKGSRDKTDKRLPGKEKDSEKMEKRHPDKEKKVKTEHADKAEVQNSVDRWKEKERTGSFSSHSPGDKNYKENDKLKSLSSTKKHEDSRKNKDKFDKRSDRERQDREYGVGDHREKERTNSDKRGKPLEKNTDHGKSDRSKEKDCDRKKRDKIKDGTLSSSSNLKLLLEEKKSYLSESGKSLSAKSKEEVVRTPEKDRDRRDRDRDSDKHKEKDKERHKDRSQQAKISKAKANETDADKAKSKASPATRDTKPKEKRLVNDDLMQTSFERMLSLKDQEIEQWHRKHLEKIKQKERERLKQRPLADPGKSKPKDRTKTEPCLSKELMRSKSSEASDVHSRDKALKDGTSPRTMSLDGKSLPSIGAKVMSAVENCLTRSPRPESERGGFMSRSVSLVSVASSEDSCQATTLTPRHVEYDSDMNLEASDSQPAFLQSSLVIQATRSPSVHDKDCNSLPDVPQSNRTLLPSRHESPYLRAILDEDANSSTEGKAVGNHPIPSQPTEEPGTREPSAETEESLNSQQQWMNSVCDSAIERAASPPGVITPQMLNKDPQSKSLTLPECSSSQTESTEQKTLPSSDPPVEKDIQCPTENSQAECSNKDSDQTSTPTACLPAEQPELTNTKPLQLTEPLTVPGVEILQQTESGTTHASDLRDEPLESADGAEEESMETEGFRTEVRGSPVPSTSSHIPSSAAGETLPGFSQTIMESRCSQEDLDANDQDCKNSRLPSDAAAPCPDAEMERKDSTPPASFDGASPEHKAEEMTDLPQSSEINSGAAVSFTTESSSVEDSVATEGSSESTADAGSEPMEVTPADERPESSLAGGEQSQSAVQSAIQTDSSSSGSSGSSSSSSSNSSSSSTCSASGSCSPQSGDRDSDSSGARHKVRSGDEDVDMHVPHPRKRKMPKASGSQPYSATQHDRERGQQSLAAIVDSVKLEEIQPYQTERANPYYEFLHIRKKIEEKRKVLCSVTPQPPQYYDEYVTFNGSYLLDGNPLSKLCIPTITPPPSLPEQLKEMFKQQEVVRMKLRLQHSIEREKLIVSNEQEVLRVHYRAARTLANQTLPFSACTVLLDAEVYNMPQDVQNDDGKTSVRDRFNARQFMSWLQDVDDKFDKLKTCLLMRQQHEAAALNAVQRLEWQLKLQELDPATYKSTSIFEIPEFYIPLVEVNDDFDLTPI